MNTGDTLIVECNRTNSYDYKYKDETLTDPKRLQKAYASWTNNFEADIKLYYGDKIKMNGCFVSESGVSDDGVIEIIEGENDRIGITNSVYKVNDWTAVLPFAMNTPHGSVYTETTPGIMGYWSKPHEIDITTGLLKDSAGATIAATADQVGYAPQAAPDYAYYVCEEKIDTSGDWSQANVRTVVFDNTFVVPEGIYSNSSLATVITKEMQAVLPGANLGNDYSKNDIVAKMGVSCSSYSSISTTTGLFNNLQYHASTKRFRCYYPPGTNIPNSAGKHFVIASKYGDFVGSIDHKLVFDEATGRFTFTDFHQQIIDSSGNPMVCYTANSAPGTNGYPADAPQHAPWWDKHSGMSIENIYNPLTEAPTSLEKFTTGLWKTLGFDKFDLVVKEIHEFTLPDYSGNSVYDRNGYISLNPNRAPNDHTLFNDKKATTGAEVSTGLFVNSFQVKEVHPWSLQASIGYLADDTLNSGGVADRTWGKSIYSTFIVSSMTTTGLIASNLPLHQTTPYYIIKSNVANENEFIISSSGSNMKSLGIASKNYKTNNFIFQFENSIGFTVEADRTIKDISFEITLPDGTPPRFILPYSSVILEITRGPMDSWKAQQAQSVMAEIKSLSKK